MNKRLYACMDWARIEEVVYGECDRPADFLGSHIQGNKTLFQAFLPGADSVKLCIYGAEGAKGKTVKSETAMEKADDAGFFACSLSGKKTGLDYTYRVCYLSEDAEGETVEAMVEMRDPYSFGRILTEKEENAFMLGGESKAWQYMGSRKKTVSGVRGMIFRVWAPAARRVSVVGDFNHWNGLAHPMNRLQGSGIFELFIPGVEDGTEYKYELVIGGGQRILKADPYSHYQGEDNASIAGDAGSYRWNDTKWMTTRSTKDVIHNPLNIYEFSACDIPAEEGKIYGNIKNCAAELAAKLKAMHYTHVQLLPVMTYPDDHTRGFHTALFFAPDDRFGTPKDYMAFVDEMHKAGIGVILTWSPADFSNPGYALAYYDGTSLYEYGDPKRGVDPRTGMLMFNTEKAGVRNYLFSIPDYWTEKYHVDAFCLADLDSMMYLDYYRKPGEWTPNMYGGVENLEAAEFLQEMNRRIHGKKDGLFTIAEELHGWKHACGEEEDGLGFDFVTDGNQMREMADYLSKDPIIRKNEHQILLGSAQYQYCERYILPMTHEVSSFIPEGIPAHMAGDEEARRRNLKLFYAWMMFKVGRKASAPVYSEEEEKWLTTLNAFYQEHPALYASEDDEEGFGWILETAAVENVVAFMRRGGKKKEKLLVIFNFANKAYDKYHIGVEEDGKYTTIFLSEEGKVGVLPALEEKNGGFPQSIRVSLAPLSVSIYRFDPYTAEERITIDKHREELRAKRAEEERRRLALAKAKEEIRANLKEELERQIREAEEAINSGSEYVVKKRGQKKK